MVKKTLRRELKQETGGEFSEEVLLGKTSPDSGCMVGSILIFRVLVTGFGDTERDDSEHSMTLKCFTRAQLIEGVRNGFIPVEVRGKMTNVTLTDGFTLAALVLEHAHGLA